jgi:hypothetical protein
MRITVDDLRAAGLCGRGAKRWAESHELDFMAFCKGGIEAEALPQDDHWTQVVTAVAKVRHGR